MNPEDKARKEIDTLLIEAGWVIQDRAEFNRFAGIGVAVREFLMTDNTEADYLLFVDGKAVGVIEAKKSELSLSGVEVQSQGYACNLSYELRRKLSGWFWFLGLRDLVFVSFCFGDVF